MDRMTQQECRVWIEALRSGKYEQCRGRLKGGNQGLSGYCCLGVAEEVCNAPRKSKYGLDYRYLRGEQQSDLIRMNDAERMSFKRIADYIEQKILPTLPE